MRIHTYPRIYIQPFRYIATLSPGLFFFAPRFQSTYFLQVPVQPSYRSVSTWAGQELRPLLKLCVARIKEEEEARTTTNPTLINHITPIPSLPKYTTTTTTAYAIAAYRTKINFAFLIASKLSPCRLGRPFPLINSSIKSLPSTIRSRPICSLVNPSSPPIKPFPALFDHHPPTPAQPFQIHFFYISIIVISY